MKTNQLKAGVVLTFMSTFISALISLVYTPVMLGILGQSEYGVYTLVHSLVANLGILSFGFGSAYVRFYSQRKVNGDEDGVARLNGMFMTVFTVIAIIALLAGAVLAFNTHTIFKEGLTQSEIEKAKILICISVVNIAISFPASVFTSYITANEKYIFLKVVNMIKTVFSPLINLPVLLLGFGSVGMVFTTLFVSIVADVINVWFCIKKLKMRFDFKHFEFKLLGEVWVFSFFIFLNIITDQINWNVDKFLLGMFQSSVAVAVYGVASQLNNYYTTVFWSVSNVFIPRVNNLFASLKDKANEALTELFIKIGRIQFIILALVLEIYVFFGKFFITKWAGDNYLESYFICGILIFAVTIEGIQSIGIEIQRAKNMHKFRSVLCFFIAIANVGLSIPLCIYFGATGAAIGTAVSLILGNGLIMNIYYHKKVGLDVIKFWKNIFAFIPSLILPTAYGILSNIFFATTGFVQFAVQVIVMCIIYILSVFFIGMNKFEKNIIITPIKKILKISK